jgi:hypothetical protein
LFSCFLGAKGKEKRIKKRYFTQAEYEQFQENIFQQKEEVEKEEKNLQLELQSLTSFVKHLEELVFQKKISNQQLANQLTVMDKENMFLTKKINNRLFILKKLRGKSALK